jgi:type I restriction enzyme S subunit
LPVILFGDHTRIFKYVDFPFALGADGVQVLVPVKSKLIGKYLYFFLKALIIENHGYSRHYKFLKEKEITIPPKETQTRIVELLEKAEQLQQWRNESDELTNDYLNSVFLKMFGDPIRNPKKWEKKKLKEFGKIVTGNTPPRAKSHYYGKYIDWVKSDNINTPNYFVTESKERLSEEGAKIARIVPKRSVLVTCIAGSISCIGNVAISNRAVAFNQQINAIIPNENVNVLFLYFLILNSKEYIQNHSNKALKGIVSKSVFESIPFIFPPSDLQIKFGSVLQEMLKMKEYQEKSKSQINSLLGVLAQRAFKGELQ